MSGARAGADKLLLLMREKYFDRSWMDSGPQSVVQAIDSPI
jgi:hypothetical protein